MFCHHLYIIYRQAVSFVLLAKCGITCDNPYNSAPSDGHVDVYMGGAQWQQIIDHQKASAKVLEQKYKEKLEKLKVT